MSKVTSNRHWHVELHNRTLVIEGEVTLATVSPVLAKIELLTQLELAQSVDLSRLGRCDSSAVALILELQRRGVVHVQHAPLAFIAIVHACQLDALFPDLAQNHASF